MTTSGEHVGRTAEAYDAGRRVGFGISALALGLVSFLSLLGAEKAILAIVLGALAVRGSDPIPLSRRLGGVAIVLGVVFLLTMGVVLVVFWDRAVEFVRLLQQLS
ncbi:MAG: hypothetical protein ACYTG0_46805 [Planctomycetota bacterium]|jgi:hypothetical protein